MQGERNELIRTVIQQCAVCKHGKARLVCRGRCYNKQVRENLKKIKQLDKKQNNKRR